MRARGRAAKPCAYRRRDALQVRSHNLVTDADGPHRTRLHGRRENENSSHPSDAVFPTKPSKADGDDHFACALQRSTATANGVEYDGADILIDRMDNGVAVETWLYVEERPSSIGCSHSHDARACNALSPVDALRSV